MTTPSEQAPTATPSRRNPRPPTATDRRPQQRMTAEEREKFITTVAARYKTGNSIRQIAQQTNRSYGTVQRALHDAGQQPRPRGGYHRAPANPPRHES